MYPLIRRTDESAFDRIRDAILNRGDPDDGDSPTDPGGPSPA